MQLAAVARRAGRRRQPSCCCCSSSSSCCRPRHTQSRRRPLLLAAASRSSCAVWVIRARVVPCRGQGWNLSPRAGGPPGRARFACARTSCCCCAFFGPLPGSSTAAGAQPDTCSFLGAITGSGTLLACFLRGAVSALSRGVGGGSCRAVLAACSSSRSSPGSDGCTGDECCSCCTRRCCRVKAAGLGGCGGCCCCAARGLVGDVTAGISATCLRRPAGIQGRSRCEFPVPVC